MLSSMSKISERYHDIAAEFTRRVEAVPAGRWDDPSPCEGWSARDVLRHMLDNHRNMPGYVGLTLEVTASVDDDPRAAWAEARDRMQALLDDPDRAGLEYEGMLGRTTLQDTVDRFLGTDLLVHGWDIARATGQAEKLPTAEVHRVYTDTLPMAEMLRTPGVCGPAVSVPDDAPEQDRLLGLFGRQP